MKIPYCCESRFTHISLYIDHLIQVHCLSHDAAQQKVLELFGIKEEMDESIAY